MPGPITGRHKLRQRAIARDQKMGGNPQRAQLVEIWMRIIVELIAKQVSDKVTAKLSGRQADIVDHQEPNCGTCGACIEIRRPDETRFSTPAIGVQVKLGLLTPAHECSVSAFDSATDEN